MILVMLMVFVVDLLLLFASDRFLGGRGNPLRFLVASVPDAVFALFSMFPGFSFLHHIAWRIVSLFATALLGFGFSKTTLSKGLLFVLLQLSLGSISNSESQRVSILMGAAGLSFACLVVGKRKNLIPVELKFRGQTLRITALRDTGHSLRDPVSGQPVLVVSADVAGKLTGLAPEVLQDPVNSLKAIPGLRLIPYKSVGSSGFLLGLQLHEGKIGDRQQSILVALSPHLLSKHYQALTGGT